MCTTTFVHFHSILFITYVPTIYFAVNPTISVYLLQRNNIKVSPGPQKTDREFVEAVTSDHSLPQYATGMLLCRNLTLEFSGVDQETKASFVRTSLNVGLSVSYGLFQLSTAVSHARQKSSFEATTTASGLRIRVPGVQMIGYYTEVIPKFPK